MPRIIHSIYQPATPQDQVILNSMDRMSALEEALVYLGYTLEDVVRLHGLEAMEKALIDLGWVLGSEFDAPYQDEHMMSMQSRG